MTIPTKLLYTEYLKCLHWVIQKSLSDCSTQNTGCYFWTINFRGFVSEAFVCLSLSVCLWPRSSDFSAIFLNKADKSEMLLNFGAIKNCLEFWELSTNLLHADIISHVLVNYLKYTSSLKCLLIPCYTQCR